MTNIPEDLENQNTALPSNFKLILGCAPGIRCWVKSTTLPGLKTTAIVKKTQNSPIKYPGHGVNRDAFVVEMYIDEEFKYWRFFYAWIMRSTLGDSHSDLRMFLKEDIQKLYNPANDIGGSTTATFLVLNNKKKPAFKVTFDRLFPTELTGIQMSSAPDGVNPLTATITFEYNNISFFPIDEQNDPIFKDPGVIEWLDAQRRIQTGLEVNK